MEEFHKDYQTFVPLYTIQRRAPFWDAVAEVGVSRKHFFVYN